MNSISIGIKNNNWLNVKAPTDDYWNGQQGRDTFQHAIFTEPHMGLRAALKNFRSYRFEHGRKTITDLVGAWTYVKDHRIQYREFIIASGVSANALDEMFDAETMAINDEAGAKMLLKAMARFESGSSFWPFFEEQDHVFDQAIEIYNAEYSGAPAPREFVARAGDTVITPSGDRLTFG